MSKSDYGKRPAVGWTRSYEEAYDKLMCACNKKKCEGECRENNLSRKKGHVCPAAWVKEK